MRVQATAAQAEEVEATEVKRLHTGVSTRKVMFAVVGLALLVLLALVSVSVGSATSIGVGDTVRAIISRLPFVEVQSTQLADVVIWQYRMPRILTAIVAGMGLAVSGTAMQGVLRNPLVSPFTIGISAAAGFGAALAIVMGIGIVGSQAYLVIVNAFVFALLAALLVYGMSRLRGTSPETLILAGIAVMYLFSAGTSLLQYMAREDQLAGVVYWLFGSLTKSGWEQLLVMVVLLALCFPLLMKYSWDLNTMAAGDDTAASLGTNTRRVRITVMVLATLITASIICFTGIIGFVCLVAPHITRMVVGSDHRFLLPCSCIAGALLLLAADTLARTAIQPTEIPVGIITSFIGVPMFVYLLLTRRRQYWQ